MSATDRPEVTATDPVRIDVELPARGYPVLVGSGWLARAARHLDVAALAPRARRALLVSQEPVVAAGVVEDVEVALRAAGIEVTRALVPDGEGAKDVGVLARLWSEAARLPLTRDDVVVAVGGGVVGDLAGFAAATYNRGIGVVQVPTTLLAQVDAAIGGKTGINLPEGKNLVGSFHQPLAVACDVEVLGSLSPRVLVEGYGEVVKYGLIRDPAILDDLEVALRGAALGADGGAVGGGVGGAAGGAVGGAAAGGAAAGEAGQQGRDAAVLAALADPRRLARLVERSARVKAAVVAADEREGGVRAHLNLGHTVGHAIETLSGYGRVLHGEAVAIGMVVALELGRRLGRTPPELVDRTRRLLEAIGLPVRVPVLDRAAVWEVLARDKKASVDGVRFVLLDALAEPVVLAPPRAEVDAVLDALSG